MTYHKQQKERRRAIAENMILGVPPVECRERATAKADGRASDRARQSCIGLHVSPTIHRTTRRPGLPSRDLAAGRS